jgi:hypothetical protein
MRNTKHIHRTGKNPEANTFAAYVMLFCLIASVALASWAFGRYQAARMADETVKGAGR